MLSFRYKSHFNSMKEELRTEMFVISSKAREEQYRQMSEEAVIQNKINASVEKMDYFNRFYTYVKGCDQAQGTSQNNIIVDSALNLLYKFLLIDTSPTIVDNSLICLYIRKHAIACFWISQKFHHDDDRVLYGYDIERLFKLRFSDIIISESTILNSISFKIYPYMNLSSSNTEPLSKKRKYKEWLDDCKPSFLRSKSI